ncbi:MAG: hypothetical protein QOH22_458 [Gemmatimonadaceae bacterium]|nr:hypothetical protein [Gemmatimonadaceae bacterium]
MNKQFLAGTLALAVAACASRTRGPALTMTEPCAALADTMSKYISVDALPLAHVVGNPRLPQPPAVLGPGDSAYVEFLVRPDGLADTSTVLIGGPTDPGFVRSAVAFAAESRFVPAQSQGCPMMSKYNLVVKSRAATR